MCQLYMILVTNVSSPLCEGSSSNKKENTESPYWQIVICKWLNVLRNSFEYQTHAGLLEVSWSLSGHTLSGGGENNVSSAITWQIHIAIKVGHREFVSFKPSQGASNHPGLTPWLPLPVQYTKADWLIPHDTTWNQLSNQLCSLTLPWCSKG